MSSLRLLDRHVSLFRGSVRTLLQRERDRRRCQHSPYAWLFLPYMGEELVAISCQSSFNPHPVISLAAVIVNQHFIQTSRAWVATIADTSYADKTMLRKHHQRHGTDIALAPSVENLGTLADFVGNRPLITWQVDRSFECFNRVFRATMGFGLPNAQVDIAKLHQKQLRRLHSQVNSSPRLDDALQRWQLPILRGHGVLREATVSALLYLRLQREYTKLI